MSRMLDPCKTCEEMTTNGEYCSLNCYLSRDKTEKEAMSGSNGIKRYNVVEQDDEGAYVYYDEHIAALRSAKVEVLELAARELCMYCNDPGNWVLMSNSGYH